MSIPEPSSGAARPLIWAVGGGKGGTGKSLLSASLAIHLSEMGRRVVLVDGDLGTPNLHTFLGLAAPQVCLGDVVERRVEGLAAAAVETGIPRVRLVSGARNSAAAESLKHLQKMRLVRLLSELPADVVILDLGAGTALNVVDLFAIADRGILVILPEPTSVENCYRFLHAAFLRRLQHLGRVLGFQPLLDLVLQHRARRGLGRPREILEEAARVDSGAAATLRDHLAGFAPHLVVNQARDHEDARLGESIEAVAERILGVPLHFAGAIPYDPVLVRSVKSRRPYLLEYPRARTSEAVRAAAEAIAWPDSREAAREDVLASYLRLRRAFRADSPALAPLDCEPERRAALDEIESRFRPRSLNLAAGASRAGRLPQAPLLRSLSPLG